MAVKAYSYLRFSRQEQSKGDSLRRQSELARNFAAKHNLELDESFSFRDLGISSFRGQNARKGALGAFLRAIDDGVVQPGSWLLVESLDRISRQAPWSALPVFQQIIDAGVIVACVKDEKIYSAKDLQENPYKLLESLFVMIRANEESATKSNRLTSAWENKRRNVQQKPLTRLCPAWLELEGGEFRVLPERAEIVNRIFTEYRDGAGAQSIAEGINQDGIEPWGRGKAKAEFWHKSYVQKILENRAVIGEMTPHKIEYEGGKRKRVPLSPVASYFPVIVPPDLFNQVQELRRSKGGQRGKKARYPVQNILARLAVCAHCGSTLTRVNKSNATGRRWIYLCCSRAKSGGGCQYKLVPYAPLEDRFVKGLLVVLTKLPTDNGVYHSIKSEIDHLEVMREDRSCQLQNLLGAIAEGRAEKTSSYFPGPAPTAEQIAVFEELGVSFPRTIKDMVLNLERQIGDFGQELKRLNERLAGIAPSLLDVKIENVLAALRVAGPDIEKLNSRLRSLLDKVVIDPKTETIDLHFSHLEDPILLG